MSLSLFYREEFKMSNDSSTLKKDFHLILAEALSSKKELTCTIDKKLPRNGIAVGTLPTGLQPLVALLEETISDAKQKEMAAAEAAQIASEAKERFNAIKVLLHGGLREIFSDIPKSAGAIGIAENWVVYYQTPQGARGEISLEDVFGMMASNQ